MAKPSVFPTGVTIYNKDKTFNGYTLYPSFYGATLIDMNGRLVKVWKGLGGSPLKPLPDGQILATRGVLPGTPGATASVEALQVNWNGEVVWSYRDNKEAVLADGQKAMVSCHHHDFEREGCAAGYYTPSFEPKTEEGHMLLLTHNRLRDLKISDKELLDERIIEIDEKGATVWEWLAHEHFEEFGLDEAAKKTVFAYPIMDGDWIHLNSLSSLGENVHYEAGDERFAPDNLICSSRQLNTVFIIDKKSGNLVWRVGPDFQATPELKKLGQIIGQHHAHMIPKGLPGEGNILLFDNGSFGGYGKPFGMSQNGCDVVRRHYSRVLEFDPVTLEIKWEYMKAIRNTDDVNEMNASNFFSAYISSAQRLPNGNTLITQGADGIMIEVTQEKEIVWEFVNPIKNQFMPELMQASVYRAYRIPYEWVPQLETPEEVSVIAVMRRPFLGAGALPQKSQLLTDIEVASGIVTGFPRNGLSIIRNALYMR